MQKYSLLFFVALWFFAPLSSKAADTIYANPRVSLTQVAAGYNKVTDISNCGDSRYFITEQDGKIWIMDSLYNKSAVPFLDIDARVNSSGNEQGLLGLAFHPQYKTNKYFYVNFINGSGTGKTKVSRFSQSTSDTSLADSGTEFNLLTITQPYTNHNGGDLNFGPDGYLYIGMGDGGLAGDPGNVAQNKKELLGKILRIDVNSGSPYGIPASNPFATNANYLPEIWALGVRNPWRHSFDRQTGDYWIADVGQNAWEEVNFQPASSPGGENYGWRCYEGNHNYSTGGCAAQATYDSAIFEYSHPGGNSRSITGGFVYRGKDNPGLNGKYICTDYVTGDFYIITRSEDDKFTFVKQSALQSTISTFGENNKGELFAASSSNNSKIYKVNDACNGFKMTKTIQEACGGTDGSIALNIFGGTGTKTILWNTTASTATINGLSPGMYRVTVSDQNNCTITDSTEIVAVTPVKPVISYDEGTFTLTSTAAVTYQWLKDGTPFEISGIPQTGQSTVVSVSGTYVVITTDINGCSASDTLDVSITGIKDKLTEGMVAISPNPSNNTIQVTYNTLGDDMKSISIYAPNGALDREIAVKGKGQGKLNIDLSGLAPGMYILKLNLQNGKNIPSKFIKL